MAVWADDVEIVQACRTLPAADGNLMATFADACTHDAIRLAKVKTACLAFQAAAPFKHQLLLYPNDMLVALADRVRA